MVILTYFDDSGSYGLQKSKSSSKFQLLAKFWLSQDQTLYGCCICWQITRRLFFLLLDFSIFLRKIIDRFLNIIHMFLDSENYFIVGGGGGGGGGYCLLPITCFQKASSFIFSFEFDSLPSSHKPVLECKSSEKESIMQIFHVFANKTPTLRFLIRQERH